MLLFQSMFPIHVLGTAMHSINMTRKFIKEKHCRERSSSNGLYILEHLFELFA
jgi:hypothetical protein